MDGDAAMIPVPTKTISQVRKYLRRAGLQKVDLPVIWPTLFILVR
jgi:hypothetical protein